MNQPIRRLYRSRTEGMLAGVFAGIGHYFDVDPVIVRLIAVAIALVTAVLPGVLVYVIAWIIVPLQPLPVAEARPAVQPNEGPA